MSSDRYVDRAQLATRERALADLLARVKQLEERPVPPFDPDVPLFPPDGS